MKGYHYVGLDVHKKVIAYCVKAADGTVLEEGKVNATRSDLGELADRLPRPGAGHNPQSRDPQSTIEGHP